MSGISDLHGRVGHNPNRIEAESVQLSGYVPVAVTPWETASGGKAVACSGPKSGSATFHFDHEAGKYDLATQYFDQNNGISRYEVFVNDKLADEWVSDDRLPSAQMNGHTSTRHVTPNVNLQPADVVKIVGHPDSGEPAPLDYLEFQSPSSSF
jgi:alpha-glucuronidase